MCFYAIFSLLCIFLSERALMTKVLVVGWLRMQASRCRDSTSNCFLCSSKKRRAGSLQNAEQCSLSKQWKCWSCSYCWSWLSTPLTVGRAAAAAGNSGWLPITTQHYIHCTPPLLWFLSSTAASWALLPSHQMYFPDAQVLLRCIFGRTTGLKISLGLHLCMGNDMQGPWDCITITHCTCREQPAILMKRLMLVKGSFHWLEIIVSASTAQPSVPSPL